MGNISDGRLDFTALKYLPRNHDQFPALLLNPGDVLFNRTNSLELVGKSALYEGSPSPCSFASYLLRVRLRGLHPKLLVWYLNSTAGREWATSVAIQQTGQANINSTKLKSLRVPVPPEPEQRRIVGILDKAFEGIATARANAEQNLANARAVFESAREDRLAPRDGWRLSPLGELCDIKHGFAFKGEFFSDSGQFVLLTPGSFYERGGYRARGAKTKYYVGEIPPEFVLREGDLLTAMTEQAAGLLGSPLIVPESGRFLHNQRLGLFVPKPAKPWVTKFFFHTMNLGRVRKEIHDGGTGAKVRHTSPGRILDVRVAYPESSDEQRAVAHQLDEIAAACEQSETHFRQKLSALDELKKSLLHHAFSGQL